MTVLLGCIADDLTGASDLAGELVARGMRTMQVMGIPNEALPDDLDAVVVALKSRTTPVAEAVGESLAALRWLRESGCERIFFKYCSTFDSTPQGNIGPVLEALAAELGADFSIACPAFPANRRTVYQGHLFVGDRLLNESGMENHPLTPMKDADLVRVLQAQITGKAGLIPLGEIRARSVAAKAQALIAAGTTVAIADAIDDGDLAIVGAYCAGLPLTSGASGLGVAVGAALMGADAGGAPAPLPALGGRRAVISGSCSLATRRQVAAVRERMPACRIALDEGETPATLIARARDWIAAQAGDGPILIYSTADPAEVARQRALDPNASAVLEEVLAEIAAHLVDQGARALVVAGGETSGAVVQRLGVTRLRIGPEIDPGVPWTIGGGGPNDRLLLALKSGNFGSDDFMSKAWEMLP
ncbi:four-carbon acid sugar kinase family protein [Sphingomonas naphthae]|uniref:3-oxo-tetronate kinase n=1 Tax=Sphingomonas naphthae TaxID=1813468 RepID=A0ABY7TN37_9SPHN|nr:3-oxo-tetronate kinase [Sphingomonas naphthae]WCT74156.1 four-carbon acid sugar kinase family protein [Sphingomonas naphthae]